MAKYHTSRIFLFYFALLLFSQVLYSEKPKEIDFILLFHVGSLALFLYYGLLKTMMHPDRFDIEPIQVITLVFLIYFYTVGVFLSRSNNVPWIGAIEFPYRIANLFMILFIPLFIRKEEDLRRVFVMMLVMMATQILYDIFLGEDTLLESRLWGKDFASIMFLASLPFAFGALLLFWNSKTWRGTKRLLLLGLSFLVMLKVFLTFSRTVWLVMFPLNVVGLVYLIQYKSRTKKKVRGWYNKVTMLICAVVVAGAVGAFGIVLFNPPTADLILSRADKTDSQAWNRTTEIQMAYEEWLNRPILGSGFAYQMPIFKGTRFRQQDWVHNFIMQFLVSSGIIGLAMLITLLGATALLLRKLFKRSRSSLQNAVMISCILALFNVVLIGMVQTVLHKEDTYFILAMIISFIVAIKRFQAEEKRALRLQEAPIHQWGIPVKLGQPLRAR